MKKYRVYSIITNYIEHEVKARTEEEAEEKVTEKLHAGKYKIDSVDVEISNVEEL